MMYPIYKCPTDDCRTCSFLSDCGRDSSDYQKNPSFPTFCPKCRIHGKFVFATPVGWDDDKAICLNCGCEVEAK